MSIQSREFVCLPERFRTVVVTALCFSCITSILLLVLTLNRGLDLVDESFYIYYAMEFKNMAASMTPFGYIIHPLFVMLGSSLIALRLAGITFLVLTGAVLGLTLGRHYDGSSQPVIGCRLALTAALCNLAYYTVWSLTPGYNLLVLGAVELIAAGALLASGQRQRGTQDWPAMVGAGLVGAGAYLAFFAKPTVAVLCSIAFLPLCWCWYRQFGWRSTLARLAIACLVCLLLFVATLAPAGYAAKLMSETSNGLRYIKLGNSPGQLISKTIVDIYRSSPFLWIVLAAFAVFVELVSGEGVIRPARTSRVAIVVLSTSLAFLAINVASSVIQRQSPYLFIFLPMLCMVLGIACWLYARRPDALGRGFGRFVIPALLVCLPCVLAFGSSIALFVQSGMYIPLTLIGGVLWFRLIGAGIASLIAELGVIVAVPTLLLWSMMFPIHQATAIFADDTPIRVGSGGDDLLVSAPIAAGIRTLVAAGRAGGTKEQTPVVDLTGTGPSLALLLGGRAPFYPFIVTSFGQPRLLADQVWNSMTDTEHRAAWLTMPIDPKLRSSLPARYFNAHRGDYVLAAHVDLPISPGQPRPIDVWRPVTTFPNDAKVSLRQGSTVNDPRSPSMQRMVAPR